MISLDKCDQLRQMPLFSMFSHCLMLLAQVDGSLAASGGLDSLGRLWDVRTGKNILNLEGHIKSILSMDFSPNGYVLATGSEDNTVRVYDLRRRDVLAVLPGTHGARLVLSKCVG